MNIYLVLMTISVILLVYPYVIYPFIVSLFVNKNNDTRPQAPIEWPMVSIIISFLNAHEAVKQKVENLLLLDYPSDKWEVIFVSDGNNDDTVAYLEELNISAVKVLNLKDRVGKTEAENRAYTLATGDIVMFTDCSTFLERDVLKVLVGYFSNNLVGAVSTVDKIVESGHSAVSEGENAYVRQEMLLRKRESMAGMMIGLSGSCYACRKILYEKISPETTRDFSLALNSLEHGYINVSAEEAFCSITVQKDIRKEFTRKVRTINNGLATVLDHKKLFLTAKYGKVSFAIISHKILRWLGFPLQMIIFVTSAFGLEGMLQKIVVTGQAVFYIAAFMSFAAGKVIPLSIVRIGVNFIIASFAAFFALIEFSFGKRYVTWAPTKR